MNHFVKRAVKSPQKQTFVGLHAYATVCVCVVHCKPLTNVVGQPITDSTIQTVQYNTVQQDSTVHVTGCHTCMTSGLRSPLLVAGEVATRWDTESSSSCAGK